MAKRAKPVGKTGPISIGPAGVQRHHVEFPVAKEDIELFIARLFCAGNAGMRPQIDRYGSFTELEQQPEDRPDFTVQTEHGQSWLELAEFAPLDKFGHAYEKVPATWDAPVMLAAIRSLIDKKGTKGYGAGVILVIYKTHETLFVPPPILRALRADLASTSIPFEAIYFVSPHDHESASTWEIFPSDPPDDGPAIRRGLLHVGLAGVK
jgi:hypothetical protein